MPISPTRKLVNTLQGAAAIAAAVSVAKPASADVSDLLSKATTAAETVKKANEKVEKATEAVNKTASVSKTVEAPKRLNPIDGAGAKLGFDYVGTLRTADNGAALALTYDKPLKLTDVSQWVTYANAQAGLHLGSAKTTRGDEGTSTGFMLDASAGGGYNVDLGAQWNLFLGGMLELHHGWVTAASVGGSSENLTQVGATAALMHRFGTTVVSLQPELAVGFSLNPVASLNSFMGPKLDIRWAGGTSFSFELGSMGIAGTVPPPGAEAITGGVATKGELRIPVWTTDKIGVDVYGGFRSTPSGDAITGGRATDVGLGVRVY